MTDKSNNASVERRPIERRVPEDKRIPLSGRNKNGKPRVGFCVHGLIEDIQHFLGYDNANVAVLVGAGHLGQALLSYGEFAHYGLKIAAAFDNNPDLQGSKKPNAH